jgi:hypothetical protein
MTTGLADMISALPTTATISGLAVQGVFTPNEQTGQLGYGGMIDPQGSEFVYLSAGVTTPSLMSVITVGGTRKRVAGINSDNGTTSLMLTTPEDVRK